MDGDSNIKITTWNVRGLGKLSNLKQVMTRLKHLKSTVQGSLFKENITMVNLYGPNDDCPKFFENIFLLLASLPGKLLIGL